MRKLRTNAAPELERARTAERSLNVRGSETSLNRLGETSCRVSRGPACGTRAYISCCAEMKMVKHLNALNNLPLTY